MKKFIAAILIIGALSSLALIMAVNTPLVVVINLCGKREDYTLDIFRKKSYGSK